MRDIFLEEAKNWGNADALSNCLALTDQISDAHTTQEPTRLNFILMALCLKGQAKYNIDTKEQTVKAGDLLFVSERHIVDNYSASADFECLCIMVSTEFYHGFVQSVQNVSSLLLFSMNNPVVALTPSEVQVFSNYFHTIREKITNTGHHYRENLVKALLLAMFYDMSNVIYRVEQQGKKPQMRADALFSQFIRLLEQNFRSIRRVSWYAEQLFITPKYLSEVVKQTSKRTPNEWIDSYVILEARVLLKTTTMSIKEIADELHFPSQSFLGKYFKEHVGVSPSEFRKQ
ncbi:AraC-type DNA-binding protein [Prevotella sp. tc2-28]|jgi:AraC-like DNA-binding protein|uniref:AraC family transcriptional regulator n=1 Tax=Prevotella sp. tc2-28 TaxID=1761888 RepID=UPI00089D2C59|nr:helix-turn-helix domain-containing protein [Prevotella sp. tc2-28]SEA44241.1 AraC-type DNA-binding protein [Prevotella sp. tc2-28]